MKKPKELHRFHKSKDWKLAREIKICDTNGKCGRCGALGEEVHHKKRLTLQYIGDINISLIQDDFELLCKKCQNKEHMRFSNQQQFDEEGNLIPQ